MNDRPGFSSATYAMPPVRTPVITVVDPTFPAPARRLAARAVDLALVAAGAAVPAGGIARAAGATPATLIVIVLVTVPAAAFAYEAICLAGWSLTPGKRLLGLRIVGANGLPLPTGTAVRRAAGFPLGMSVAGLVPVIGQILWLLDAFSPCWDRPRRRCWHDRMAGTVVIGRDTAAVQDGDRAPYALDEPAGGQGTGAVESGLRERVARRR